MPDSYRGFFPVKELENVLQSLNDYQRRLDDMHLSLEHKNRELWTLAHNDPLTGVFNRRAFEDDWDKIVSLTAGRLVHTSFLLFDCDHFKAINDTYGHQTGDMVIKGIAESLHEALRTGDRLYRLGGDEFATLLFDTDTLHAQKIAERCIIHVNSHDFAAYSVKEPVRISIGLAYASAMDKDSLIGLHKQADLAMYHAKRPGQNKIAVYADNMSKNTQALISNLETNAVYEAIASINLLEIHYQKIVRLPEGNTDYYEALVRIHNDGKLIMPSGIFPVVEARRLDVEFDLAVVARIKQDLEQGVIPAGSGVSINVSGPGIVSAEVTQNLLALAPHMHHFKLVLEVTETALITQINHAAANLHKLRKTGFIIALDDFGSGYSSLRYLSSMPVDLVKFDISMVHSLNDSGRQSVIVENLARLINNAGYQLVAEGIETQEMLEKVSQLGFSHAQGYFVGRPGKP